MPPHTGGAPPGGVAQLSAMAGKRCIDLNADLGEGFGRYRLDDAALLDTVTSASIACGFHAGDPVVMRETVRAAAARNVAIGAHPGYPDLQGFGRRELAASPDEIAAYVLYQLGALQACCAAEGTRVRYVKPHGALYHRAARDAATADAIAAVVRAVDPSLVLLGPPESEIERSAARAGLRAAREAFLDRGYQADGTLVSRDKPGAFSTDVSAAAGQAVRVARESVVRTVNGTLVPLAADSLCIHGDGPAAAVTARAVRHALEEAGVCCAPFVSDA